jgi:hypothetical protein
MQASAPARLQGVLAPKYHKRYFMGLAEDNSTWSWLDPSTAAPEAPNYVRWGTSSGEPNATTGNCSVGDFLLPGYSALTAASWAAAPCASADPADPTLPGQFAAICKTRAPGSVPPLSFTTAANDTFTFSTVQLSFSSAATFCQNQGGQLVSFQSQPEQLEVERGFIDMGVLLPGWHKAYWLGLYTKNTSEPRTWRWNDPFVPYFTAESYTHWGTDSNGISEPNNASPPESCVAGNHTQAYEDGVPNVGPWGWSDEPCSMKLHVMCRITRGWRRAQACSSGRAAHAAPLAHNAADSLSIGRWLPITRPEFFYRLLRPQLRAPRQAVAAAALDPYPCRHP